VAVAQHFDARAETRENYFTFGLRQRLAQVEIPGRADQENKNCQDRDNPQRFSHARA
jgi:hypothetical protein